MLKFKILPDYESLSRQAADLMIARIGQRPDALFCLATGATPLRAYEMLAEHYIQRRGDLERWRIIKLDEWGGLAMNDAATCERHLRDALINPLGLSDRYLSFQSQPADAQQECGRVARELERQGPIDTCVLGLGINGHLGFNEPAEFLQPHAHIAKLSSASLQHAMLRHSTALDQPAYGLTLGVADLLQSRQIMLLVSGPSKREPLRRLLADQVTTDFPASLLLLHPDAWLLCDDAAWPGELAPR